MGIVHLHQAFCTEQLFYLYSCASSKHLQTRRFLDTLQGFLLDIQRTVIHLHRAANERPSPFVDHSGVLRDARTGRPINGRVLDDEEEDEIALRKSTYLVFIVLYFCLTTWLLLCVLAGYSFFGSGDVEKILGQRKRAEQPYSHIGKF